MGLKAGQTQLKGELVNWKMGYKKITVLKNGEIIGQKIMRENKGH